MLAERLCALTLFVHLWPLGLVRCPPRDPGGPWCATAPSASLVVLLASAQVRADGDLPHLGIELGNVGTFVGAQAEVTYWHLGLSFGAGYNFWYGQFPAYAAGLRVFSDVRRGIFLAGGVTWTSRNIPGDVSTAELDDKDSLFLIGSAGYRWLSDSGFFFEASLGAMRRLEHLQGFAPATPTPCGDVESQRYSCSRSQWLPTANLGIGFQL